MGTDADWATSWRMIDAGGHRLAVLDGDPDGAGPPIVFIHGVLCSVRFWPSVLGEEVRQGTRWYSLGLPGHYPCESPQAATYTPESLSRLYAEAIEQLTGGQPAALVGWSTGAFVALNLAATHPHLVDRVLSVSGFADGRWHGLMGIAQRCTRAGWPGRAFARVMARVGRNGPLFRLASRAMTAAARGVPRSPTTDILHADFKQHRVDRLVDFLTASRTWSIAQQLQNIQAPTTIACGNRDSAVRFSHAQELARRIPDSRLIELDDCGHFFFGESPRQFEEVLSTWLSGVTAESRAA